MKATPRFSFARTTLAHTLYGFTLTGLLTLSAAHASDTPIALVRETFQATRLGGDATQLEALPPWLRTRQVSAEERPVLNAYHAASEAMQAGQRWNPLTKLTLAHRAIAALDLALKDVHTEATHAPPARDLPAEAEVQLIALNTFSQLPTFLHTRPRAHTLLLQLQTHPDFGQWPADFRAAIYCAAVRLHRAEQVPLAAQQALQQAKALARHPLTRQEVAQLEAVPL